MTRTRSSVRGHNSVRLLKSMRIRRVIREPILCVSDTHLRPNTGPFCDDAPLALAALLRAHPSHRVFVLGDFLESLPLSTDAIRGYGSSARLAPVFDALRARSDYRIVPGNHDTRALGVLADLFGDRHVFAGGFVDTGVRFVHGHERNHDLSHYARPWVTRFAVPLQVTAKRLGFPSIEVAQNRIVARSAKRGPVRGRKYDYVLFGHTHRCEVRASYANTGSFLRRGRKTFVVLEHRDVRLHEWLCR